MTSLQPQDMRVLLIEDAPATAAVLQLYLEEMGMPEAHWIESLEEAEALAPSIERGDFDVIVSDLILSDADASGFLNRVMAAGTRCQVLICSGDAERSRKMDLPAEAILAKPVSYEALSFAMARLGAKMTANC
ncbi:response regulator [Maribius pontilimi]|uniref:Response regulator n=1 Tax=Palleronia pontilimi TaxID=1964209 RepID=A0A934IF62_9RHOB|nr:response regulator [Palleronia pontilimi]MBJ3761480.1 response regulator [Palleronia pontilimi]